MQERQGQITTQELEPLQRYFVSDVIFFQEILNSPWVCEYSYSTCYFKIKC